uniref:Uncharacterized protein n=1 Tax=Siphoviridae sp. ctMCY8 TaxID=2827854 RepID=A0A8S5T9R3_9CAUD|nr:MAG TPA: hypothetical protein [Siphoviridae sp. ctMCY8]
MPISIDKPYNVNVQKLFILYTLTCRVLCGIIIIKR